MVIYGGANVRLQPLAADDIDWALERTGDVFQAGIIEHCDVRRRIEFHRDVVPRQHPEGLCQRPGGSPWKGDIVLDAKANTALEENTS